MVQLGRDDDNTRANSSSGGYDAKPTRGAEGDTKAKADAVLTVLQGRGLAVSDEARTRIARRGDLRQPGAWIRRAVTVSSVEELMK